MRQVLLSLFLCIILVCSCHANEKQKIIFDKVNTVYGIYTKCILSHKNDTLHYGFYKIVLNDLQSIVLLPPYDEKAKRTYKEVSKFEGKRVIVTGTIIDRTYLDKPTIYNSPQTLNIPCFITIDNIELDDK